MNDRLLGSLGLCAAARKLIFGTPMVTEAMKNHKKIYLVVEASDTSENTHKRLNDRCAFYGVRKIRLDVDGATLASALGKSGTLAAAALTDESLYRLVCKHVDSEQF